MATRYLWIKELQQPYDARTDARGRALWGMNIIADREASATFLEELVALLVDAGLGEVGVSIFWTSQHTLPEEGDGPYISLVQTGGPGAVPTQNTISPPARVQTTAHIVVTAADGNAAKERIYAVYTVLVGVRNQSVTPVVVS